MLFLYWIIKKQSKTKLKKQNKNNLLSLILLKAFSTLKLKG